MLPQETQQEKVAVIEKQKYSKNFSINYFKTKTAAFWLIHQKKCVALLEYLKKKSI